MHALPSTKDSYVSVARKDGSEFLTHIQDHRPRKRKSWRAPAMMVCALILGFGVAIAQHFLYTSLDGKPVSDVKISGLHVSQAWISRISTGLAFLVKVALTISVGAAFVQHQWLRLQREPLRVKEIDTITSALGNFFCFFESAALYRNPVLAIMALVSWTIPLGTIVTPGALTVQPIRLMTNPQLQVPQPSFNLTNYGKMDGYDYAMNEDPRLTRLLAYTAASGAPVHLQSSYQNQTYKLVFNGPALKCGPASDAVTHNASLTYANSTSYMYDFASWTGFDVPVMDQQYQISIGAYGDAYQPYGGSMTEASISVMIPSLIYNASANGHTPVNVTECVLYNATYDVDFTFHYPNQTHVVQSVSWINTVSIVYDDPRWGVERAKEDDTLSYVTMMTAYGRLLVGDSRIDHYGSLTNQRTNFRMATINWTDTDAVQQGMETLFQNFTLSLLSDSAFTKNSTTADFIPVEAETWPITYVYDRKDVFLAYGVSLLATLACALVGLRAFGINNGSYQNLFSTYLRATSEAGLASYIEEMDSGDDPLPKPLSEAKVRMSSQSKQVRSGMGRSSSQGGDSLLQG